MDALLGTDFAVAEKNRLYRCLDRVLEHKPELFLWLRQKWADLFHANFEALLYDLTSTYFEGAMEENPKAKYGHSRDQRTDCLQVVIALVITPDGFPLAYEVTDGNTSDRATLRGFLDHIEKTYGKAKRMWVMDRGIPSEEILREMRDPAREIFYLVGTPKGKIQQYERKWLDLPWQKVRDAGGRATKATTGASWPSLFVSSAYPCDSVQIRGENFLVSSAPGPAASATIPSAATRPSAAPAASTITPTAAGASTAPAAISAMRPVAMRTVAATHGRRSAFAIEVRLIIGEIASAFNHHRSG
jgi:hypothetical protein